MLEVVGSTAHPSRENSSKELDCMFSDPDSD